MLRASHIRLVRVVGGKLRRLAWRAARVSGLICCVLLGFAVGVEPEDQDVIRRRMDSAIRTWAPPYPKTHDELEATFEKLRLLVDTVIGKQPAEGGVGDASTVQGSNSFNAEVCESLARAVAGRGR